MHPHRSINRLLATVILYGTMTSCIYDYDNCPPEQKFTIVNDWTEAPDASPGGMAYIFFPEEGGEPWRFDFPGTVAGNVPLPVGRYSFLSYNDDTFNVAFREDDGYYGYTAYTRETDILYSLPAKDREADSDRPESEGEKVVECPDMMWGCAYYDFSLSYEGVNYIPYGTENSGTDEVFSPKFILEARQKPLTPHYTCRVEDVENLSGVKSLGAALSGMAGSLVFCSGERTDYPVTLPFNMRRADERTIEGDFHTFGLPDSPDRPNVLYIFVVLKDGRKFSYRFDVTDQVRKAPDPMEVTVVVRGLKLEESEIEGDGGFDVGVDGWITIIVNITS